MSWWENAAQGEAAGRYEPGDYDEVPDPDPTPLSPARRATMDRLRAEREQLEEEMLGWAAAP